MGQPICKTKLSRTIKIDFAPKPRQNKKTDSQKRPYDFTCVQWRINICTCVHVYIHRERDRDRDRDSCIQRQRDRKAETTITTNDKKHFKNSFSVLVK